MPHCGRGLYAVVYAVAALWECDVCGEGSGDMIGYCGAGGRGWRRGEGESKVVSGYAVADGEGICEYEGARDRSEVVTVE